MANTRAQAGGQYGKNGEWYNGGEFLPSSTETEKGAFSKVAKENRKATKEAKRQNALEVNAKIDEVLAQWYPNNTAAQAREFFVKYLKDNGVNTWKISPYGTDLAEWVL